MDEVQLLIDMLRFYTPPLKERGLSEFLAKRMEDKLGFSKVRIDPANNLIGEVGSGRPQVLLCGHSDTVPGYLKVKVTDTHIYGRGAVDAKGALAAMVSAASELAGRDEVGKVIVVAVTDEEGGGTGIAELVRSGIKAEYAIFGEPSGIGNITIGYKGRVSIKIRCRTQSVHASAPWMGQNAVEKVFEVWSRIKGYVAEQESPHDRYGSLSACLTKIRGGSAHNVLPARCEATVDIRVPPQLTCQMVVDAVRRTVEGLQSSSSPRVEVEFKEMTEPFEADKRSSLVRALSLSAFEVSKKWPRLVRKTGTGDMSFFGHFMKVPVVSYGPGDPHLSHTQKEGIEIKEYLAAIEIYKRTIINLARLHKAQET